MGSKKSRRRSFSKVLSLVYCEIIILLIHQRILSVASMTLKVRVFIFGLKSMI